MMTEQLRTIWWNFSAVVLRKGLQQNPSDYSETGVWWGGLNSLNSFCLFSVKSYIDLSCKEFIEKRLQLFKLFGREGLTTLVPRWLAIVAASRFLGSPSFCGRQLHTDYAGNARRRTALSWWRQVSNRFQYYHPFETPRISWALTVWTHAWTRAA